MDEAALAGKECIGGLDLSRKIDLTALVLAFEGEDGVKSLVGRYWTPLEALDGRSQAERELFQQWLKAGHLIGIEGRLSALSLWRAKSCGSPTSSRLGASIMTGFTAPTCG